MVLFIFEKSPIAENYNGCLTTIHKIHGKMLIVPRGKERMRGVNGFQEECQTDGNVTRKDSLEHGKSVKHAQLAHLLYVNQTKMFEIAKGQMKVVPTSVRTSMARYCRR